MPEPRSFRFAGSAYATATGSEFVEAARRVEALGYDTFLLADHFQQEWFAVGPALAAAAAATSTLRVGSLVYSNNFRHPALLAREAATVDVLSNGRMEMGIGAGYEQPEYAQTGIDLPTPAERVERLQEALTIIKGLWGQDPLTHSGKYYTITGMEGWPKPLQQPHPPIQVGGGGRRMLTLAAQQADIVGIIARSAVGGGLELGQDTHALVAQKVAWVREAAGARFDELELAALIFKVVVTDRPRTAAEELAAGWGLTADQVLDSPYFLIGSLAAVVEDVHRLREQHGISYLTVFPGDVEVFAPAAAQLSGS
jgi:probable F420-dependent oxidoreductase